MRYGDLDAWMEIALDAARRAAAAGEVPVGAALLRDGELIATGRNRTEQLDDPCAHAEILALRAAGESSGDWRLDGTTMVVTLEPCAMCLGAIALARVERLAYGAPDPRLGACGSALPLLEPRLAPHLREVRHATHPEVCGELLRRFFRELRAPSDDRR